MIDIVAANVQNLMNLREKEGGLLQSVAYQTREKELDEGENSQ